MEKWRCGVGLSRNTTRVTITFIIRHSPRHQSWTSKWNTCPSLCLRWRSGAAELLPSSVHSPQFCPTPKSKPNESLVRHLPDKKTQTSSPLWSSVDTHWPRRSSLGRGRKCSRRFLSTPIHQPCGGNGTCVTARRALRTQVIQHRQEFICGGALTSSLSCPLSNLSQTMATSRAKVVYSSVDMSKYLERRQNWRKSIIPHSAIVCHELEMS